MGFTVAVAGKGGTGKTTLCALIIQLLVKKKLTPILAVDADPNTNLNMLLGMDVSDTIADIREEFATGNPGAGISKTEIFDMKIQDILSEGKGVDLLAMGRPEGPGCYCAANNILRMYLDRLSSRYRYVVIDNEAGMEHLSRRTTSGVERLLIIVDSSKVSLRSAKRIEAIAKGISPRIEQIFIIGNRIFDPKIVEKYIADEHIDNFAGIIPGDERLREISENGSSLADLPEDSAALKAVEKICVELGVL